jgi:hypothetical protein
MRVRKWKGRLTAGLIGITLFASATIQATTLARLSLDQLTAAADAVARVRCVSAGSKWENGQIWTITTFDVVEPIKGSLASRVVVRLPGGRVGHLTAAVEGAPRFAAGEETIVFLQRVSVSEYSVAGWVQGTFRIAQNLPGNEIVTQDSSTFAVFDMIAKSFRVEGIRRMSMDEFRRRLALARSRSEGRIR